MSTLVTGIAELVTHDPELGVPTDAALVVDGGRVAWVGRAGAAPEQLVMAASAADVHTVVVDGRVVVSEGQHVLGDVGRLLADAIEPLWEAR